MINIYLNIYLASFFTRGRQKAGNKVKRIYQDQGVIFAKPYSLGKNPLLH